MDPPTQDSIPSPPSPPQPINTYHCLCTHLLLATTHTLSSLPRRKAPGLDNAIILPLPPPPTSTSTATSSRPASPSRSRSRSKSRSRSHSASSSSSTSTSVANDNDHPPSDEQRSTHPTPRNPKRGPHLSKNRDEEGGQGYSILLSATLDRKAVIVRREDGFEKRYLWRCGRCRLVVGYQVDEVHFLGREAGGSGSGNGNGNGNGNGRRGKVVYLLPGGLVSTEEMNVGGRAVGDEGWV